MTSAGETRWEEFVPFLAFPAELRKVVYTTNAVEWFVSNGLGDEAS
jgi:putative transposase